MSKLVIGEGVELELRLAQLPSRLIAFVIDALIQVGIAVVALIAAFASAGDASLSDAVTMVAIIIVLVLIGYPVLWETLSTGRSPGKLAMGLRVVRADGGPERFRHAFVRALSGAFIDQWMLLGTIGVIVSLCSRQGRRVGDMLAGTIVIRERVPRATRHAGPPPQMPAGLETWARSLELSQVPQELALAVRQYLGRAHELRPEIGADMSLRLAREVSEHVTPPPPAGVSPSAYLAAVIAEQRRRELARYQS